MAQTMTSSHAVSHHRNIGDWRGWDYVPGLAFIIIGVLALVVPPLTSLATGIYLGALFAIAGVFALAGGIANVGHRGAWVAILLGLVSIAAGVMMLYNPVAGAISLAWVIGAWFLVGGIFELATAFTIPIGRGWLMFVGIVNVVLGGYVLMMNPANAFLFVGYLVGVSFVMRGLWSVMFTAEFHKAEKTIEAFAE